MRVSLIYPMIFGVLLGCNVQTYNSSSGDEASQGLTVSGDSSFLAANAVLRQKCSSCHDYHRKTASELVAAGDVVAGNLAASPLFARLKGAGVGGNENMPVNRSMSAAELAAIETWILNLTP